MNKNLIITLMVSIILISLLSTALLKKDSITPTPAPSMTVTQSPTPAQNGTCDGITILIPKPGEKISSPMTVNVVVDNRKSSCKWTVFEAQAGSVILKDLSGEILAEGNLITSEEWMTEGPINFSTTIEFKTSTNSDEGILIVNEENPSGIPEEVSSITIPVRF